MYFRSSTARAGVPREAAQTRSSHSGVFHYASAGRALVIANTDGIVLSRTGRLACWTPPPGSSLFDCPVLFGMQTHIHALMCSGGCPEIISDVRIGSDLSDVALDLLFERSAEGFIRLAIHDASERQRHVAARLQRERFARFAAETAPGSPIQSIPDVGACRTP